MSGKSGRFGKIEDNNSKLRECGGNPEDLGKLGITGQGKGKIKGNWGQNLEDLGKFGILR